MSDCPAVDLRTGKAMKDITVRKKYTVSSKYESRLYVNDNCEVLLFLRGDVRVSVNGRNYTPEPGDMLLFGSGEIHTLAVSPGAPFERIYIYFDKKFFQLFSDRNYDLLESFNLEEGSARSNLIGAKFAGAHGIGDKMADMFELYQSESPDAAVRMASLMLDILVNVNLAHREQRLHNGEEDEPFTDSDKIHEILRYIVNNLDEKFTLDSLSSRFFISKFYLCHEFKRVVGVSCLEYIRQKRVNEAGKRLLSGESVNDAWLNLGFTDYLSFYRSFKKVTGVSPNEYALNERTRTDNQGGGKPQQSEGS